MVVRTEYRASQPLKGEAIAEAIATERQPKDFGMFHTKL